MWAGRCPGGDGRGARVRGFPCDQCGPCRAGAQPNFPCTTMAGKRAGQAVTAVTL